MIKYIEHKNIDKQKWDVCIDKSTNACIFVYSWYLDVVAENWSALVLNDYEAVFPLATKSKYKINYLYQPFFTRYFGVYSKTKVTEKLLTEFIETIPTKFKYFEFCLHESNAIKKKDIEIKPKQFQLLDLKTSYQVIQNNYSDNAKRSIKKAIKSGLKIRPDIEPEKIVSLFKTTKGNELEIFKPRDYAVLIELMNTCLTHKQGQSIAIYDGDKLCAAAFFMFSNNKFIYLKNGLTEDGKAKGAMYLLIDYFIRENSGKQYELDFGGSSVESVAQFYRKFGAKDLVYLQVKKNNLPKVAKWIKQLKS